MVVWMKSIGCMGQMSWKPIYIKVYEQTTMIGASKQDSASLYDDSGIRMLLHGGKPRKQCHANLWSLGWVLQGLQRVLHAICLISIRLYPNNPKMLVKSEIEIEQL